MNRRVTGIVAGVLLAAATGVRAEARSIPKKADAHESFSTEEAEASSPWGDSYALVVGRMDALATYVSPLNYSGFRPSLAGAWTRPLPRARETWAMRFDGSLGGGRLMNSPGTAIEYTVSAAFSWGAERVWRPAPNLTLTAGANVGFDCTALWLTRNSNNPVSLPLWAGFSGVGSVRYDFRLGKLPVSLSERVTVPSLGAFFMPGYGESYYEIYLGNRRGLVHCGWWGNAPGVRSHLEFTLRFRRGGLALGYLLDYRRFRANHLSTRLALNALTVSWVR